MMMTIDWGYVCLGVLLLLLAVYLITTIIDRLRHKNDREIDEVIEAIVSDDGKSEMTDEERVDKYRGAIINVVFNMFSVYMGFELDKAYVDIQKPSYGMAVVEVADEGNYLDAVFDWNQEKVKISYSYIDHNTGYQKEKTFNFQDKMIKKIELFEFIQEIKKEHDLPQNEEEEITEETTC